jgi:hypothetical protein
MSGDYPELRPDRVHEIVALLLDNDLTPKQRVDDVFRLDATDAERTESIRILQTLATREHEAATSDLVEAGALHEITSPTIADATLAQLQTVAAAYGVLARWDLVITRPDMPLGNALKLIPPEDAETVVDLLRRGGLLPPNLDGSAS